MRIARPQTLLSLTLVGLGLVTLPLLIAVGNAVFRLDQLMEQSAEVANRFAGATNENQRVTRALINMERYAQFAIILQDQDQLRLYRSSVENLERSLSALEAQERPPEIEIEFQIIRSKLNEVESIISSATDNSEEPEIAAIIGGEMATAAANIANGMRNYNDALLASLRQDTRQTQRTLFWQAAALIPGTLILVLFFVLLVGRPMRSIDRAIRELGKGDFSHEIAVTGPRDIETLGRQLEWLRLRLAESSEEKNKFLRHMSHELKTPLANIREGTELLLDGSVGELDPAQREVTDILRANGLKLQQLIENLLSFSAWQTKSEVLTLSDFPLRAQIINVARGHSLALKAANIRLRLEADDIIVNADQDKIRTVLDNLLSNAIKFTPRAGVITIRANRTPTAFVFEFGDTGPGIPQEERSRVFDAFFQGRREQGGQVGGTGIGLSVVQECIQAHDGSVELVDSDEFPGAHFRICIPQAR